MTPTSRRAAWVLAQYYCRKFSARLGHDTSSSMSWESLVSVAGSSSRAAGWLLRLRSGTATPRRSTRRSRSPPRWRAARTRSARATPHRASRTTRAASRRCARSSSAAARLPLLLHRHRALGQAVLPDRDRARDRRAPHVRRAAPHACGVRRARAPRHHGLPPARAALVLVGALQELDQRAFPGLSTANHPNFSRCLALAANQVRRTGIGLSPRSTRTSEQRGDLWDPTAPAPTGATVRIGPADTQTAPTRGGRPSTRRARLGASALRPARVGASALRPARAERAPLARRAGRQRGVVLAARGGRGRRRRCCYRGCDSRHPFQQEIALKIIYAGLRIHAHNAGLHAGPHPEPNSVASARRRP